MWLYRSSKTKNENGFSIGIYFVLMQSTNVRLRLYEIDWCSLMYFAFDIERLNKTAHRSRTRWVFTIHNDNWQISICVDLKAIRFNLAIYHQQTMHFHWFDLRAQCQMINVRAINSTWYGNKLLNACSFIHKLLTLSPEFEYQQ